MKEISCMAALWQARHIPVNAVAERKSLVRQNPNTEMRKRSKHRMSVSLFRFTALFWFHKLPFILTPKLQIYPFQPPKLPRQPLYVYKLAASLIRSLSEDHILARTHFFKSPRT